MCKKNKFVFIPTNFDVGFVWVFLFCVSARLYVFVFFMFICSFSFREVFKLLCQMETGKVCFASCGAGHQTAGSSHRNLQNQLQVSCSKGKNSVMHLQMNSF